MGKTSNNPTCIICGQETVIYRTRILSDAEYCRKRQFKCENGHLTKTKEMIEDPQLFIKKRNLSQPVIFDHSKLKRGIETASLTLSKGILEEIVSSVCTNLIKNGKNLNTGQGYYQFDSEEVGRFVLKEFYNRNMSPSAERFAIKFLKLPDTMSRDEMCKKLNEHYKEYFAGETK